MHFAYGDVARVQGHPTSPFRDAMIAAGRISKRVMSAGSVAGMLVPMLPEALVMGMGSGTSGAIEGAAQVTPAAEQAFWFVDVLARGKPLPGDQFAAAIFDTARKINADIIRERTGASRSGVPLTRIQL